MAHHVVCCGAARHSLRVNLGACEGRWPFPGPGRCRIARKRTPPALTNARAAGPVRAAGAFPGSPATKWPRHEKPPRRPLMRGKAATHGPRTESHRSATNGMTEVALVIGRTGALVTGRRVVKAPTARRFTLKLRET